MGQKMLLNLPEKDLEKIETLVKMGEYSTKTEFIRFAIKQLLYSQDRMRNFEESTRKLQAQTKKMGLNRKYIGKEIEKAKKKTRRMIRLKR